MPHRHLYGYQITFVKKGRMRAEIDGATLTPPAPCVLALPRTIVHGFTFSPETEGWVITLPDSLLARVMNRLAPAAAALDRPIIVGPDAPEAIAALSDCLTQLARETTTPAIGGDVAVRAFMHLALVWLARSQHAAAPPPAARLRGEGHLQRFRDLVDIHFRQHWAIDRYARELGLTAIHLNRLCHSVLGITPSGLVRRRLTLEAHRLLAYSDRPVGEIAFDLGFADPAYFTRFFRREAGINPAAFRRARRGDAPGGTDGRHQSFWSHSNCCGGCPSRSMK